MKMSNLVLSRYRDPWTPWTEVHSRKAQWVADYFERMGRVIHERGFLYWLVSLGDVVKPDGTPFLHTETEWAQIQDWVRWARYLKIGDWSNLIDRKHPEPRDYSEDDATPGQLYQGWQSPQGIVESELRSLVGNLIESILEAAPYYETGGYQTYLLVVYCEKNTMNDYIDPVVAEFKGVFQPLVGESSVERVEAIMRRADEVQKPVRIFYISDFDPSGDQMPISVARKVEWFAREKYHFPFDVKLKQIALTHDQVVSYRLPSVPLKSGDSRARGFMERFGDRATELDALEALHPGELAKIVIEALEPYYDYENPEIVRSENYRIAREARRMVEGIRPQLEEVLDGLKVEGLESLDLRQAVNEDFEAPEADHYVADSNDGWLLDTDLDYDRQLELYRRYRSKR